jgi:hypothetical protein
MWISFSLLLNMGDREKTISTTALTVHEHQASSGEKTPSNDGQRVIEGLKAPLSSTDQIEYLTSIHSVIDQPEATDFGTFNCLW